MTSLASLTFAGSPWQLPVVAAVAVLWVALAWSYRGVSRGLAVACFALKAAGVLALALCLLEPLWTTQRARPGANLFAVVADNSQGLTLRDPGRPQSRGEEMRGWLDPGKASWPTRLESDFSVRRYLFDARLQNVQGFGELDFTGKSSGIATALRTLAERHQGRPLAGILLFTDGNATDVQGPMPTVPGLPPVYPVVVGRPGAIRDLSLGQVGTTQTVFEDAPVTVQAEVRSAGFDGAAVRARVVDVAGKVVAEQGLTARGGREAAAFRAPFKPEAPGVSFYRVEVAPAAPAGGGPAPAEATDANNARVVAVDRGRGPYRILYVAGRPNWEFKFLNRAVAEDPQLQMVGLIRVARREPKFDFRGRGGETSNPLFRGFGDQGRESAERYDQPVLTRVNARDAQELQGGFPKTAEELYAYHAVLLDDVEADFFRPEQMVLLSRFVSERGGSLLMLGGMESFQEGGYQRTPVGDLLPVHLDRVEPARPAGGWRFQLSREGWLQPWARLRDVESEERARIEGMPAFGVLNRVRQVKPGASVVATVTDDSGAVQPALAVQRFGRGHAAALLLGDVWRWGLQDAASHADMDKAWRQLVRWLVSDVPRPVELSAEPLAGDASGAMRLQVRARDPRFLPLDNASVHLEVRPVFATNLAAVTNVVRLVAEPSAGEPGVYEATYVPRIPAGYHVVAAVTNAAGAEVGRAEAGWGTDLAAEEFRSLEPDVRWLEDLARQTGGQVVSAAGLDAFVASLPLRAAPRMEPWSRPLWNTPAWFGLALVLFLSEWALRRWRGLA